MRLVSCITLASVFFLGLLQYRLWLGHGGIIANQRLRAVLDQKQVINTKLREENTRLANNIKRWKSGDVTWLEMQARFRLGMIKSGEVFYQFVESGS